MPDYMLFECTIMPFNIDRHCTMVHSHTMNPSFANLRLKQIDARLGSWHTAKLSSPPPSGWIKAIRQALGMPAVYLAKRMGIGPTSVLRMESSEAEQTVSLATLRRAAEALDCELVYALVPRKTLAEQIEHQARSTVREQLARVTATMALEAQQTSEKAIGTLEDEMVKELLSKPRKALWK